ncbi:MAG: ATP synthase F1 subunit epsilon [Chthoniobacterales bacterium]|nr:ATP synthase F1 subunit epsilon [Chthoniobacterales bacterium]
MPTIHLEIVTPEHVAYEDDVDSILLPTTDGEIAILPLHTPLLTQVIPGELVVSKNGQNLYLAIGEGFAEITQTNVRVLADMALQQAEIDEDAVQIAIRKAEESLSREQLAGEQLAAVQATLQKSLAQLKVKRRRNNN